MSGRFWARSLRGRLAGVVQLPLCISIILGFIKSEVERAPMTPPRPLAIQVGEIFRVDAKAEGDQIVIGGWESLGGISTWQAR